MESFCNDPQCSLIHEGVKHTHHKDGSVELSEHKIEKSTKLIAMFFEY